VPLASRERRIQIEMKGAVALFVVANELSEQGAT